MEMTDVYKFIMNEAQHGDLEQLRQALKIREEALGLQITTGDQVMIANISPKYLNGTRGVVTAVETRGRKTLATLKTDLPVYGGRHYGQDSLSGIPVQCLRKVTA